MFFSSRDHVQITSQDVMTPHNMEFIKTQSSKHSSQENKFTFALSSNSINQRHINYCSYTMNLFQIAPTDNRHFSIPNYLSTQMKKQETFLYSARAKVRNQWAQLTLQCLSMLWDEHLPSWIWCCSWSKSSLFCIYMVEFLQVLKRQCLFGGLLLIDFWNSHGSLKMGL